MKEILFVFVLSIMILVYFVALIRQNRRDGIVGTYSAIFFSMIVYFGIIPIFCFTQDVEEFGKKLYAIRKCDTTQFLFVVFCLVIFSTVFHITYRRYNNYRKKRIYRFDRKRLTSALKISSFLTVVIGGASFIIYIYAFGGVSRLLYFAEYLRTFASSATEFVSYYVSLLFIPAKFITVAPVVILAMILQKEKRSFWQIAVFLFSLILAMIFNLANAGKAGLVIFVMCFTFPFLRRITRRPWCLAIVIGIVCLPLLGEMDKLFVYMRTGVWSNQTQSIYSNVNQFAYVFQNVMHLPKMVGKFGLRWGQDFITGFLDIIPGINFDPAYVVTSEYFNGVNWVEVAGRPTDVITFGYLQFGPFGIVLMAILLGVISAKIDRIMLNMPKDGTYYILTASMITCTFSYFVNADVSSVVKGQFQLWVVALCVLYASRVDKDTLTDLETVRT